MKLLHLKVQLSNSAAGHGSITRFSTLLARKFQELVLLVYFNTRIDGFLLLITAVCFFLSAHFVFLQSGTEIVCGARLFSQAHRRHL